MAEVFRVLMCGHKVMYEARNRRIYVEVTAMDELKEKLGVFHECSCRKLDSIIFGDWNRLSTDIRDRVDSKKYRKLLLKVLDVYEKTLKMKPYDPRHNPFSIRRAFRADQRRDPIRQCRVASAKICLDLKVFNVSIGRTNPSSWKWQSLYFAGVRPYFALEGTRFFDWSASWREQNNGPTKRQVRKGNSITLSFISACEAQGYYIYNSDDYRSKHEVLS